MASYHLFYFFIINFLRFTNYHFPNLFCLCFLLTTNKQKVYHQSFQKKKQEVFCWYSLFHCILLQRLKDLVEKTKTIWKWSLVFVLYLPLYVLFCFRYKYIILIFASKINRILRKSIKCRKTLKNHCFIYSKPIY